MTCSGDTYCQKMLLSGVKCMRRIGEGCPVAEAQRDIDIDQPGYCEHGIFHHAPGVCAKCNDAWRIARDGYHPPKPRLAGDAAARKNVPMARGLLDYFPNACAAVAELSRVGNKQHNPGEPMHWARDKSTDHADCIVRHLLDRGTIDTDGQRHSTKIAWRALALLQTELEEAGEA